MILLVHNLLWSSYKGAVLSELIPIGKERGCEINVLHIAKTNKSRSQLTEVDLTYHNYNYDLLFSGSYNEINKFCLYIKSFFYVFRHPAKIILLPGYDSLEYWIMLLAAKLSFKKVGVFCDSTIHDNSFSYTKYFLKSFFLKRCVAYFGYGIRSRDYLIYLGCDHARIFFRCQAPALPKDYNKSNILNKIQSLEKSITTPRFLYVGRLSVEKSIDDLLIAFSRVVKKYEKAILVIVGDGPQKSFLYKLADSLNITESVIFTGSLANLDVNERYIQSTCLVLPSKSEPWGLVVNEALSYGCPVIVSNFCGCAPELVNEGVTGFIYPVNDIHELENSMLKAIEKFQDSISTAKACIEISSLYTSERAAIQIITGIEKIFKNLIVGTSK